MRKNALRAATVEAEDVPAPACTSKSVVLANRHSLISAGTETTAVGSSKRDMVVKAIKDPDIRQSVVDMLVQDGVRKTADRVQYEMTKWTPLGYSGAGMAVEVGKEIEGIRPGDAVAYAGQGHAEFIRASKNLCVPVPNGVTSREAAFVALGSIALQAVRRADVQVGDTVAVLGLGLVGQLVSQLLQAAGARVVGTDVIEQRMQIATQLGAETVLSARGPVEKDVLRTTGGVGVDRVMLCASTNNSQVIEQAVKIARDRGRIVVVGQVNLDVPRNEFYMKELDLVISRSYGPGRYDASYEEHGVDYPLGYVRWTEQRNMAEFLRLIAAGRIDVEPLITHEFSVAEAAAGYDLLMNRPQDCLGVLLEYDQQAKQRPSRSVAVRSKGRVRRVSRAVPNIAVIGCGAFARQFHLPNLQNEKRVCLHTLVASSGQTAREMAERYGAQRAASDAQQVFDDPDVDAVMIFTRDRSHAPLAAAALDAGKHVFCEKPLATSWEDIELLQEAASDDRLCMTGFNRRFAPMLLQVKAALDSLNGPKMIQYRVNAGSMPSDHWVHDAAHSAGRIVGEACHFVDLFRWLTGAEPVRVTAIPCGECPSNNRLDNVSATLEFGDGSVATLIYTAQGAPQLGKERLEAFCDGTAIAMDDFRTLTVRGCQRLDERRRRVNKGHDAELRHFADAIIGTAPPLISIEDGLRATAICEAIVTSARSARGADISEHTEANEI